MVNKKTDYILRIFLFLEWVASKKKDISSKILLLEIKHKGKINKTLTLITKNMSKTTSKLANLQQMMDIDMEMLDLMIKENILVHKLGLIRFKNNLVSEVVKESLESFKTKS